MAIVLLSLLTSSFTAPVANVAPPTALRVASAPQLQLAPGAAKVATRVRVSHILVDSEEMANTVKQSIEDGMEFASVAESLSSCDSNPETTEWNMAGGPMTPLAALSSH